MATKNTNDTCNDVPSVESIVLELYEIGAVKFGEFTLKSGIKSPIYIDLRVIVSHPLLLYKVSELIWSKISKLDFDILCGVPYTALPIATCISLEHKKAMVMRRKEVKTYGTKKQIEGQFEQNAKCIIIEDLVTSGTSVLETLQVLNKVGLQVTDVAVLIDRQQGGKENLANNKLNLYSCYTITEMLTILSKYDKIKSEMIEKVLTFLKENSHVKLKFDDNEEKTNNNNNNNERVSYLERSKLCKNAIGKELLCIMSSKKSNLCVAADVSTCEELLILAENSGPYICMLKTHIDIITDFNMQFIEKLKNIAKKHNFLLFEDRKFADIGNTVMKQFGGGIYKISSWAHVINAHSIPGPGIIDGLKKVSLNHETNSVSHGLLLLAEMSSKGNLATNEYTSTSVQWAQDYSDFVIGFISRRQLIKDGNFIHMTPGVNLQDKGDATGQQYLTPHKVICENGSDMIIVGRGIYQASDQAVAAKTYRDAAWQAYLDSLNNSN